MELPSVVKVGDDADLLEDPSHSPKQMSGVPSDTRQKAHSRLGSKGPSTLLPKLAESPSLMYSPAEVYQLLVDSGVKKVNWTWIEKIIHGVMGGVWIGLTAQMSTIASSGATGVFPDGIVAMLYAAVFPVALVAIAATGADLFTSSCMTNTLALMERRVKWYQQVISLTASIILNISGSVLTAFLVSYCGGYFDSVKHPADHARLIQLAEKKVSYELYEAFIRGVPCNLFVCLSFYLYTAAKDAAGKMLFVWFAIAAFAIGGFEHVVANAYTISAGMMYGANVTTLDFLGRSTFFVGLGNAVGGILFMALLPWIIERKNYNAAWNEYAIKQIQDTPRSTEV
eukprot:GHVN01015682.1.p1 GENE.GHVN01015682.1~~GHVN01015682.1.p1  ORF type:complete len:341 (+),score=24.72 GHVN01015682.1:96-1118(+)